MASLSRHKCSSHSKKETTSGKVQSCIIKSITNTYTCYTDYRIHGAIEANAPVIDVDGSFLYRKHVNLGHSVSTLPMPACHLSGWESVSAANLAEVRTKIPRVTQGLCCCH